MGLRAVELFAGVGGFRLGLQEAGIEVVWTNQWEPGKKQQWAWRCYEEHFGEGSCVNEDIAKVPLSKIPDHDILTGGFPCQDYSVATTKAEGLHGKKGVLWWEIYRILKAKQPPFALLENVDRLLKSPTEQRGRDFGVMLACMASLGYAVEWRVINAADYSGPQKRRRIFIFAAHKTTYVGQQIAKEQDRRAWLQKDGVFATAFPVVPEAVRHLSPDTPDRILPKGIQKVSDNFSFPFQNSGLMVNGKIWTTEARPKTEPLVTLGSILQGNVPKEYFVPEKLVAKWKYLKGSKAEKRKAKNGFEYHYTEGPLPFPDALDRPSRTILTSEGGTSPSRFKHIVEDPKTARLRVLMPMECELLNQFPKDWTAMGMPENWRYFCMGNALVVGLVGRAAKELVRRLDETPARGKRAVRRPAVARQVAQTRVAPR